MRMYHQLKALRYPSLDSNAGCLNSESGFSEESRVQE